MRFGFREAVSAHSAFQRSSCTRRAAIWRQDLSGTRFCSTWEWFNSLFVAWGKGGDPLLKRSILLLSHYCHARIRSVYVPPCLLKNSPSIYSSSIVDIHADRERTCSHLHFCLLSIIHDCSMHSQLFSALLSLFIPFPMLHLFFPSFTSVCSQPCFDVTVPAQPRCLDQVRWDSLPAP